MKTFDAVIVGSGFGGAVAACRLAERGRSVLVLERGRRWGREDFPRPGQAEAPWWFRQDVAGPPELGLFELRRFPTMKVLVAAGVGGGSLVYTNVQKIPSASTFAGWPAPITLERLQPCYQRVRAMLEPRPIPHSLQRLLAFEAAHSAAGLPGRVERPPLAIRWSESEDEEEQLNRFGAPQKSCNLCGLCVLGCDRHAKNTLDLTYLKRAEALGAEIRPLCRVERITPRAEGYQVSYRQLCEAGKAQAEPEESTQARSVYLAAGSLGTTELLLRCRDLHRTLPNLSPRLGWGWSANGDFFAGLLDARLPLVPTVGPSVAAGYDASEAEEFYVLEGAIPATLAARQKTLLRLATRALAWLRLSGRRRAPLASSVESCGESEMEELLRYLGAFFLMGRDASDGRLRLDPRGRLGLLWDARQSELLLNRMRRYLRELGKGYGGWMLAPPHWWEAGLASTVHPLGGCGMGRNPSEGVVDAFGRVFGYPNLYVCDGSIFPRALGVPPSMTIAALAEHIAEPTDH